MHTMDLPLADVCAYPAQRACLANKYQADKLAKRLRHQVGRAIADFRHDRRR